MGDGRIVIKHVEATLELLRVFTNDERYVDVYEESLRARVEKGEEIYMCSVIDAYERRGMEKGTLMTLISLVKDELLSEEIAAERAGLSVEEFKNKMQE